jgi:hypothetical protein
MFKKQDLRKAPLVSYQIGPRTYNDGVVHSVLNTPGTLQYYLKFYYTDVHK